MAMILFISAYALFLVGYIGVMTVGANEFWLWFLALAFVLDGSLILLGFLDAKALKFIKTISLAGKISHLVAFILAAVAAVAWLGVKTSTFNLVLSLILILWAYSLIEIIKSWRRKKRNE
ncbi:MAG: hypothetical protein KBA03_01155 [Anaerolineaceae bacterium]|nr:hypothetical protein [Anaerolineaceae bacterium]